jgi:choline kinase
LLPLTADRPKCLIEVGGRTILEHQVAALREAGIGGITVVGGYRFDRLERFVAEQWRAGDRPELVLNPFYAISSSIGSVWAARHRLDAPFCLLNGDTVYDPALVADALARCTPGINLLVEAAAPPMPDDMLVRLEGGRVAAVGKDLPTAFAHHRSLGFVVAGEGAGDVYGRALSAVIAEPDGVQRFHHEVIGRIARSDEVAGVLVDGGRWVEVDRPEDIAGWDGPVAPGQPPASVAAGG